MEVRGGELEPKHGLALFTIHVFIMFVMMAITVMKMMKMMSVMRVMRVMSVMRMKILSKMKTVMKIMFGQNKREKEDVGSNDQSAT